MAEAIRIQRHKTAQNHKQRINAGTLQSVESAEILAQLDAAAARLDQLAKLSPLQHQIFGLTLLIPTGVPDQPRFATSEQRAEITRLLNHPQISRPEKSRMLLKIHSMKEERAAQAIVNLTETIQERELKPYATTHPALASDGYQLAYDEYNSLLNHALITDEERLSARQIITKISEAALKLKIAQTRTLLQRRAAEKAAEKAAVAA